MKNPMKSLTENRAPASRRLSSVLLNASARVYVGAAALLVSAGPALAQAQQLLPPENEDGIKGKTWMSGFITLLLLSLVVSASFLKSKRGHQD